MDDHHFSYEQKLLKKHWYDEAIVNVQQWKLHTILVSINIVAMGATNIIVMHVLTSHASCVEHAIFRGF